jgi:ABC-type branched-subunit amino acid transport system substrate-binding protein
MCGVGADAPSDLETTSAGEVMRIVIGVFAAVLTAGSASASTSCVDVGLIGNFRREFSSAEDPYAREMERGVELALNSIRDRPPCLKIHKLDTNNSIANVADVIGAASKQGVRRFVGLGQSQYALAAMGPLTSTQTFLVSPTASSVELLGDGSRVIMLATKNSAFAESTAAELRRQGVGRVAIIFRSNLVYSREMEASFSAAFKRRGGEIVISFGSASSHFDVKAWALAAKGKTFTHVYMPVYESDAVEVISAILPSKPLITFVATNSWNTNAKVLQTLASHPDFSALVPYTYDPAIATTRNQEFVREFRAKFSADPTDLSAYTFESTLLLHQMLAKCKNTVDLAQIRSCFAGQFPFDSVTGRVAQDQEGMAMDRPVLFKAVGRQSSAEDTAR